jgi:aryl-alcohol dehydrogenase-like predicted oxidoreductase
MKLTRREFTRLALGTGTTLAVGNPTALAEHHELITRPIPSSGERIPIIGVGTNRYGVENNREARLPLLDALKRFHELGGTLIDTAPMYRSSELVLGDLIAELGIRDELFIATKADREAGGDETDAQMRTSQERLQTRHFELMQVHNLIGWREALPVMREWKEEGRIRYVGITTSSSRQYGDFEAVMREQALDFIQVNYSLEQQESADRLLPLAKDRGMAVIINRGFGGGRIFGKVKDMPLPEWAQEFASSWAQFLLKYALSHPAATAAIPGMTKVRHVEDNMKAATGRMPTAAERRKMEDFYKSI